MPPAGVMHHGVCVPHRAGGEAVAARGDDNGATQHQHGTRRHGEPVHENGKQFKQ